MASRELVFEGFAAIRDFFANSRPAALDDFFLCIFFTSPGPEIFHLFPHTGSENSKKLIGRPPDPTQMNPSSNNWKKGGAKCPKT